MPELNLEYLNVLSRKCRYDIVRMIDHAGSGHLGGSLSSVDIYILLQYIMEAHDRLVISHGHTAAAVYSVLGNMGYFDVEEAVASFRKEPPFEGHPSIYVNGVEWCSGCLGQGLSVGCGFALAKKLKGEPGKVYVVMGDGEQQKGQLQEAREFAVQHQLDNLVAIVDCNGLQASGGLNEICGQSLRAKYEMSGWKTVVADGHSYQLMYDILRKATGPLCMLAATVMGKGIPEIENNYRFHGTLISNELVQKSLEGFCLTESEQAVLKENTRPHKQLRYGYPEVLSPKGSSYKIGEKVDIRSAMGKALNDVAVQNMDIPIAAMDCDLEASLKLSDFKKSRKDFFIECGIAEQNAAAVAAALAKSGVIAIHADFSMFNIAETYSQNRMADINKAPVKLFATHAGLDVGEDGKTHQSIDYLSLLSNLHGFQVIIPADANQAEAAVRYALSVASPVAVIGGRSKLPVLCLENGEPLDFVYGKAQWLRKGTDGVIVTYGNMVHRAVRISDALKEHGVLIGILNVSSPVDMDEQQILEAAKTKLIVTYEDHNVRTGIAGSVAKILCEKGLHCRLLAKGISKYGASASPERLYKEQGLDEDSIVKEILNISINA